MTGINYGFIVCLFLMSRCLIEYLAVWNDFYTQYNGEKEVDDFEKWFNAEFETPAEPVITKLIKGKSITRQEEKILTRFVMAQDLRVPARVNFILDTAKKSAKDFMNTFSLDNVTKDEILYCALPEKTDKKLRQKTE